MDQTCKLQFTYIDTRRIAGRTMGGPRRHRQAHGYQRALAFKSRLRRPGGITACNRDGEGQGDTAEAARWTRGAVFEHGDSLLEGMAGLPATSDGHLPTGFTGKLGLEQSVGVALPGCSGPR